MELPPVDRWTAVLHGAWPRKQKSHESEIPEQGKIAFMAAWIEKRIAQNAGQRPTSAGLLKKRVSAISLFRTCQRFFHPF